MSSNICKDIYDCMNDLIKQTIIVTIKLIKKRLFYTLWSFVTLFADLCFVYRILYSKVFMFSNVQKSNKSRDLFNFTTFAENQKFEIN